MSVTVCVGEWSRRPSYNSTFIHGRLVALVLVIRQWRSRVGRWLLEWSHSTAEQSTTTTTRPRRHKLSSQAVVAKTIMLQRTHITTLRCTPRQHLAIQSAVTTITASLQLTPDTHTRSRCGDPVTCIRISFAIIWHSTATIIYKNCD